MSPETLDKKRKRDREYHRNRYREDDTYWFKKQIRAERARRENGL